MPNADEHRTLAKLLIHRQPSREVEPRLFGIFVWPDVPQISHAHRFDFPGDYFHNFGGDVIGVEGGQGNARPKMHAGRRGENGDGRRRAAKPRRRNSVGRLERPRERLMGLVTGVQRHLDHLLRARSQVHRRPLQAQSPHMVRNRLTRHRREDAIKMKTRKTGQSGQFLQIQLFIQMLLDMPQHPQNALNIIIPLGLMPLPCVAHLHLKLANAIKGRLTNFAVLQFRQTNDKLNGQPALQFVCRGDRA